MEDNVIQFPGPKQGITELEKEKIRVRILCAFLDSNLPGWRADLSTVVDASLVKDFLIEVRGEE